MPLQNLLDAWIDLTTKYSGSSFLLLIVFRSHFLEIEYLQLVEVQLQVLHYWMTLVRRQFVYNSFENSRKKNYICLHHRINNGMKLLFASGKNAKRTYSNKWIFELTHTHIHRERRQKSVLKVFSIFMMNGITKRLQKHIEYHYVLLYTYRNAPLRTIHRCNVMSTKKPERKNKKKEKHVKRTKDLWSCCSVCLFLVFSMIERFHLLVLYDVMFGWKIAKHILYSFSCIRHCQTAIIEWRAMSFFLYVSLFPLQSTFFQLFDAIRRKNGRRSDTQSVR